MKNITAVILLALVVFGAVIPGCRQVPRYDGRLTAIDSLMCDDPDSVVTVLEALSPNSSPARGEVPVRAEEGELPARGEVPVRAEEGELTSEGDLAYRDLLLTQARYKAYITATSDSDINRALAYFRAHPADREKLTRAYIYKGAVMDELGHPDSAMLYYKHAEATAAPDDYFNLGYTKMRIGSLYNDYYSSDGQETLKYEQALECFKKANDSVYILFCLNNLGCLYRELKPKKAESMLVEASNLARRLKDSINIAYNDLSLIVLYYHQGKFEKARPLIWELTGFDDCKSDYKMCFTATNVYARLGVLDTAEFYYLLACKNRTGDDALFEMYRLKSLSELSLAQKDSLQSLKLERESTRIEDSLLSDSRKMEILSAEVNYDMETVKRSQYAHKNTVTSLIVLSALAVLFISLFYYRKAHRYDKLISDLREEIQNKSIDLNTLQHNINKLEIKDSELKNFIISYNEMMLKMIEECYHSPHGPLAKEIKRIVKFQEDNKDSWYNLFQYLDLEFNDIMTHTKANYPQLGEKELLIIALTCMGYSCAQIAIVLDYSSSSGISTIRKRIAKKMGLDCLLIEYIKQFKSEN